ncbi:MAG TPA: radical SAM protein [Bacteroidales bacterium]|nr:radical SAM protein [Bacteroidales bacterium]
MRITFLVPPSFNHQQPAERTAGCTSVVYPMPNLYELTVAACLERENYEVDYRFIWNKTTDFEDFISKDASHIYIIWSVNLAIPTDLQVTQLIRRYHPLCDILFLGPAPTYFTDKFLLDEHTFAVRGEPDLTTVELVKCIENQADFSLIDGISFLQNGQVFHNPSRELIQNLDDLPFPARHFIAHFPFSNPKLKQMPYTAVVTSRNCPYSCIYCVPSSLTFAREIEYKSVHHCKPPVSFRSVENVVEEIELLASQGYKAIAFLDDNFIWNEKRLIPIADTLKRHDIRWGCQARVDAITENIAKILADSHCQFVDLGVESFDDDILKFIHKKITRKQIIESIRFLNQYEVPVKLNILIGTSPLETNETIKNTLREVKKLKVSQVMFNIVSPFPGTEFYQMAKDNHWIEGDEYRPTDVQRHSILNYPHLSSQEMEKLLFRNNLFFFLSPRFIVHQLGKFHSFKDFTCALKALKIKLFG